MSLEDKSSAHISNDYAVLFQFNSVYLFTEILIKR